MWKIIIRNFTLVVTLYCLLPNLMFGINKNSTVFVENMDWYEVTYSNYGIRFFLPLEMKTTEFDEGPFSGLLGTTEDGVMLVVQATPQSVTLEGLEEWVLEDLGIDGEGFTKIDEEESFHNLTYRTYMNVGNSETYWIMVARNLSQDFSYVIYVQTPTELAEAYQKALIFWLTNIYGL